MWIVVCIVIIVLMVIQNKIILPQFAYIEHIHKKTEVLLTHCIKPALLKFMVENVMHRSLYEKVRKKVMNEQLKKQMNTCRALYNKLICVFICAETTLDCFNVHLH